MKLNTLLCIIMSVLSLSLSAQENGPTIYVDLDISPTGKINRVELPDTNGDTVGHLLFSKNSQDRYDLGFDFSPVGANGLNVQFLRHGRILYTQNVPGGPDMGNYLSTDIGKAFEATLKCADEDAWWLGVLAVAYCCIEITVSSSGEGSITSTITFDCDCVSISLSGNVFDPDGNEYEHVDEIVITTL